mgnify:CR=1 FL=1
MALVKYNNNSISAVTSAASIPSGALTHIKTLTASSSSTLSFVHGSSDVVLDSTYPIYLFKFINIHPSEQEHLYFNLSADSGSNYNVEKTSTLFQIAHNEADSTAAMGYESGHDLANGTGDQKIANNLGTDNDENFCGEMFLYSPSSTTFVKHFMVRASYSEGTPFAIDYYIAGYGNTTSAINAVIFRMNSGNIDSGKIKLYGIKDS